MSYSIVDTTTRKPGMFHKLSSCPPAISNVTVKLYTKNRDWDKSKKKNPRTSELKQKKTENFFLKNDPFVNDTHIHLPFLMSYISRIFISSFETVGFS